ncbi:hypothetical protein ADEAN_000021500 [Angomonas deanei]|uniref:Glutamate-5-semialdehyde dehydrogenase n=1 Tax=Angomonas deanei TaxID=59799 RepID=A0A7G2C236_9TRYP|nr:hypothetical protein ADEAN_000021500 [Angomonas deanei]
MRRCRFLFSAVLNELQAAVEAKSVLAASPLEQRHLFLKTILSEIAKNEEDILHANRLDCATAMFPSRAVEEGIRPVAKKEEGHSTNGKKEGEEEEEEEEDDDDATPTRMTPRPVPDSYNQHKMPKLRIDKLLSEVRHLISCPDPLGSATWMEENATLKDCDPQMTVCEVAVPLGFVGVLSRYRARMAIDAITMGILAGNAVLVDGGAAVQRVNRAFVSCAQVALNRAGLPAASVVHIENADVNPRKTIEWLQVRDRVDVAIVCGPPKLYEFASQRSCIPLIRATSQVTTLYIDRSASFETAMRVIVNSKYQREGAANAVTLLLVHAGFPRYAELMRELRERGMRLLGDQVSIERAGDWVSALASDEDYRATSLSDISHTLCIKTMDSLEQVLLFLDLFGSKQNDGIVATDEEAINTYCTTVDSAVVLVNASTRLSSGQPMGLGPDLAIATSKMNHRGPFTISSWTSKKYIVKSKSPDGALRR